MHAEVIPFPSAPPRHPALCDACRENEATIPLDDGSLCCVECATRAGKE